MSSLTPAEVFWATAFLSTLLTRFLADHAKIRLYIPLSETKKYRSFMIQREAPGRKRIHVHHFIWGIVAAFVSIAALYYDQIYLGVFAAGIGVALIASEAKELVLQRWGK